MQTKVVISINLETKTFTVLEWVTPELVCMVANGNGFEFLNPQKTETLKCTNINVKWSELLTVIQLM